MTNDYDVHPQDLDARYQQPIKGDPRDMPEAAAIRSRLTTNLRTSVEEAHNLATFYGNFAQTLELCLSQLETKK